MLTISDRTRRRNVRRLCDEAFSEQKKMKASSTNVTNSINSSFPSSSAHIVPIFDNMPNHRNESMIDSNGDAKLKTAAHDAIGSCIHEDSDLSNFDLNKNIETTNETSDCSDLKFILCEKFDQKNNDISFQIAQWVALFGISLSGLAALLIILRRVGLELPKDPRTLLKTPTPYKVKKAGGGSFCYIGLQTALKNYANLITDCVPNSELTLHVNMDGIPLSKSSNTQLWLILGTIKEIVNCLPFVIALYSGPNKPSSLKEYLSEFVEDIKEVAQNGICIKERKFFVKLKAAICDAPARAFIKGIKNHNGYSSCERCTQEGVWHQGRMIFLEMNAPLRTDCIFKEMSDPSHHVCRSPFADLELGLVSNFPLDYMHLVCLGITRKLIYLWLNGP